MSNTFNIFILNNFRQFTTTTHYHSPGDNKGKGKATKEDLVRWAEEEAAKKITKENPEKDQEEKETEKAIQESKWSEKLNTNEEAGPSKNQNNPVVISDNESNSDSSIDTEFQYANGMEDQILYYQKLRKNYENKNSDDPSFTRELEVYIKAQQKELESVREKLSNFDLSKAERSWQEGRQTVIVKELDDSIENKETLETMFRNEQHRIAHLYDDEGLGKTPSPTPPSPIDEDSEDDVNSDSDNPDDSGPSATPSNPNCSSGPENSGSNESGPTIEEGSNGSQRVIISSFVLNFVAEIFEHITNIFFF